MLLVTNFANVVQTININEAAANTASTNCAIVPLPVVIRIGMQHTTRVWLTWFGEPNLKKTTVILLYNVLLTAWCGETIGAVAGNNTTNNAQSYEYTDNDPLTGISYYRLMQVDADGGN